MPMRRAVLIPLMLVLAAVALRPAAAESPTAAAGFDSWLKQFKSEARKQGVPDKLLADAFAGVQPIDRVIELDRRQPEFTLTFWHYLDRAITPDRVAKGRALMKKHRKLLDRVEKKYGVQPRFLVAFWGMETGFGAHLGSFPLIGALATLAYDERRSEFFRKELMAALAVMQRDRLPLDVKASWAGAMGNMQFIPTTYKAYAVDFDGDHKRDMFRSLADSFASAANYLKQSGWDDRYTWGREVKLPTGFDPEISGLDTRKSLKQWNALGIRRMSGKPLPDVDIQASLVLPAGYQGPAFLVYQNFRTILVWNRSILYAVAVGHLADRLIGLPPLSTPRPKKEVALSRQDVMDLQRLLGEKGFDAGTPDGIIGAKTRSAIKDFQKSADLPADGYPSFGLLERLKGTGG